MILICKLSRNIVLRHHCASIQRSADKSQWSFREDSKSSTAGLCVQGKKIGRRFVGWINGFVWYSQMLALTKQLTLISLIIYDMWVYTWASYRETECTSVKKSLCVCVKQLLHFPTDRETEQRKEKKECILRDNVTL